MKRQTNAGRKAARRSPATSTTRSRSPRHGAVKTTSKVEFFAAVEPTAPRPPNAVACHFAEHHQQIPGTGKFPESDVERKRYKEAGEKWIEVDGQQWQQLAWDSLPQVQRAFAGRVGSASRSEFDRFDMHAHCGWWWCWASEHERPPPWGELLKALSVLKDHKIDPWSTEVAAVAHQFDDTVRLRSMKADCAKTLVVLKRCLSTLSLESHQPREFVVGWIRDDLGPLLQDLQAQFPNSTNGRGKDFSKRRALLAAKELGWTASDVAAVLRLTGAVRDDFKSLTDSVRKLWVRTFGKKAP